MRILDPYARRYMKSHEECDQSLGFPELSLVSASANSITIQVTDFSGRISRVSRRFSSEKSYSPRMSMCAYDLGE